MPVSTGGLRAVAHVVDQVLDVGIGGRHVSGLHRQVVLFRFAPQALFQHLNEAGELYGIVTADVVQAIGRVTGTGIRGGPAPVRVGCGDIVQRADYAFDDVINVGEVPLVVAVIEDINRFARENPFRKYEQRHVRPAPGTIDGKEPQPRRRQPVEVAVGMRHQLIGLFRGRVETEGMIHVVVNRERHGLVGAVD
jgi:hypothetical protein